MDIFGTIRDFLAAPFDPDKEMDALHLALLVVFVVTIALAWKFVVDHFEGLTE